MMNEQFNSQHSQTMRKMKDAKRVSVLVNHMLRSGTSVGANIHEANFAASRADFINKLQIALKECCETDYWLSLLNDTNNLSETTYHDLYSQCCKLRRLLIASITTV